MTKQELDVIDTPTFQRLHNIRQLGTAFTVFPGATHTRFSHSLGVMHIIHKLAAARGLEDHLSLTEKKKLRMAALLHDVGHYPLSHVIEVVMTDHDKRREGKHEENSAQVLRKYLKEELERNDFDPEELARMIQGKSEKALYTQLLHSELDADRMDFLLRDSQNTGVRYGAHDIDRLIHSVRLDKDGKLAVYFKGMAAAEDYMIARYHMYTSVYSHKVIMGFAELVQHAYSILMESGEVYDLSRMHRLTSREFSSFDDHYLFTKLKNAGKRTDRSYLCDIIKMIITREPLEVACEATLMMKYNKATRRYYLIDQLQNEDQLKKVSKDSGVPDEWIFHSSTKTQLSTLQIPYASFGPETKQSREMTEAIHIIHDKGNSKPLIAESTSLAHYLKHLSLGTVRIYTSKKHRCKLEKALKKRVDGR